MKKRNSLKLKILKKHIKRIKKEKTLIQIENFEKNEKRSKKRKRLIKIDNFEKTKSKNNTTSYQKFNFFQNCVKIVAVRAF